MSLPYTQIKKPPRWVSANDKCEFEYELPAVYSYAITDDGTGKLRIQVGAIFFEAVVGGRVYIATGIYTGFHAIKTIVSSTEYVLESAYISDDLGINLCYSVVMPTIELYAGYTQGEVELPCIDVPTNAPFTFDMFDAYPLIWYPSAGWQNTRRAQFIPEVSPDGKMRFDIQGYLPSFLDAPYKPEYQANEENYVFDIENQLLKRWVPKYYNKVRVQMVSTLGTGLEAEIYVCNSGLTTEDLNRDFVNTERQLHSTIAKYYHNGIRFYVPLSVGDYIHNIFMVKKYTI